MKKLTFILLLLSITLYGSKQEKKKEYICLPCKDSCDLEIFDHNGPCSTCKMELVEKGTYNKTLTKDQITEDFTVLITTLKNNHPGIYDYQSENDFNQTITSLKAQIPSAKNVLDEYKIMSKLISSVSDAHTYVMNPYYQNILQEELLFPIIPKVDNNKILIDGERLKSINGYQEEEILNRLQAFSNSDGNTIPYKNAFIEMEFPIKYFTFIDNSQTFEVVLANGKTRTLEGKSFFKSGLRNKQSRPSFSVNGNNAILKIPSWEDETATSFNRNLDEMAKNSTLGKFIKKSLETTIKAQTKHLIIDLRGNKGGKSGPAAILLRYLINKPFAYYNQIKVSSDSFPTKKHITNKELVAFYESEDSKKLITKVEGSYFFKKELLPTILPQLDSFSGSVEILVDKYSLSVSTDVVAILKKNREVKITGDEIGGSLEHYCAGNYINLKLPNSGIEVNIPLQRLAY